MEFQYWYQPQESSFNDNNKRGFLEKQLKHAAEPVRIRSFESWGHCFHFKFNMSELRSQNNGKSAIVQILTDCAVCVKVGQEKWKKAEPVEDGWLVGVKWWIEESSAQYESSWVVKVVGKQPPCVNNEGGTVRRGEPSRVDLRNIESQMKMEKFKYAKT